MLVLGEGILFIIAPVYYSLTTSVTLVGCSVACKYVKHSAEGHPVQCILLLSVVTVVWFGARRLIPAAESRVVALVAFAIEPLHAGKGRFFLTLPRGLQTQQAAARRLRRHI